MPRHSGVKRTMDGKVKIVVNSIEHTLSTSAFIELMTDALRVVESIERDTVLEMRES